MDTSIGIFPLQTPGWGRSDGVAYDDGLTCRTKQGLASGRKCQSLGLTGRGTLCRRDSHPLFGGEGGCLEKPQAAPSVKNPRVKEFSVKGLLTLATGASIFNATPDDEYARGGKSRHYISAECDASHLERIESDLGVPGQAGPGHGCSTGRCHSIATLAGCYEVRYQSWSRDRMRTIQQKDGDILWMLIGEEGTSYTEAIVA